MWQRPVWNSQSTQKGGLSTTNYTYVYIYIYTNSMFLLLSSGSYTFAGTSSISQCKSFRCFGPLKIVFMFIQAVFELTASSLSNPFAFLYIHTCVPHLFGMCDRVQSQVVSGRSCCFLNFVSIAQSAIQLSALVVLQLNCLYTSSFLLLVVMPGVTSSFLLLVVMHLLLAPIEDAY